MLTRENDRRFHLSLLIARSSVQRLNSSHLFSFLPIVLLLASSPAQSATTEPGATKSLGVPASLILDGMTPVPSDLPEQIGRYTESRAASFADWHPGASEMLILTRFGDTNQVHLVKQPGGARIQLSFAADRVNGAIFDQKSGDFFIFSKSAGGSEFNQNYRYDFATGEITLLTDGKSRNSLPIPSRDGSRVAYTSTRRDGTDNDVYLQNPRDAKTDRLLAEVKGGGWQIEDWSPDGRQLLLLEYISINESYLWLLDTTTGARTELTPRQPAGVDKISYSQGLFAKDGKGIFVTTDRDSEFQRLAYIDLASKEHTYLLPNEKWDVN